MFYAVSAHGLVKLVTEDKSAAEAEAFKYNPPGKIQEIVAGDMLQAPGLADGLGMLTEDPELPTSHQDSAEGPEGSVLLSEEDEEEAVA